MATKQAGSSQFLSAADIIRGGTVYEQFEMPELSKNGKPGVVHLRPLSAGDVLEFVEASGEGEGEGGQQQAALIVLMSKAVVTPDGDRIFDGDNANDLRAIPIKAFNRLAGAVTKMAGIERVDDEGGDEGEVSEAN